MIHTLYMKEKTRITGLVKLPITRSIQLESPDVVKIPGVYTSSRGAIFETAEYKKYVGDVKPKKVIVIKNRLINIVI